MLNDLYAMINKNRNLFYEISLDVASFSSKYISQPNTWGGHTVFAALLIRYLQPDLFVELGTHTGTSYFSFCEAVKDYNLNTRCYAVDTWKGDEQAGYYGEEVYEHVKNVNHSMFSDFSTLLRMTFNDALPQFDDRSIDLIHFDGLHTYEAVKHDFESWLPKLAPGAVVLFHDIKVRDGDFGVWKLWDELKTVFDNHIEFDHCFGLGVIQLPGGPESNNLPIFGNEYYNAKFDLINYFSSIGECINSLYEIQQCTELIHCPISFIAFLNSCSTILASKLSVIESQVSFLKESVATYENRASDADIEVQHLNQRLSELTLALSDRDRTILLMKNSTSWKLTMPVRFISMLAQRQRNWILQMLRMVYYRLPLSPEQHYAIKGLLHRIIDSEKSVTSNYRSNSHSNAFRKITSSYTEAALASAPVRILLIERSIPKPDQDAGSMMIFCYIRALRDIGCSITFFPVDLIYDQEYTPSIESMGVKCLHAPNVSSLQEHLSVAGSSYNIILACRPDHTDFFMPILRDYCPQSRIIYETHDLHFVREMRQAELENRSDLKAIAIRRKAQELRIAGSVACTLVVSEQERQILLAENPRLQIEVIPVVCEYSGRNGGFEKRRDLIFIGGYEHLPNVDAVLYFANDILPLILKKIPDIRFHVVGSHPPDEILSLNGEHVIVHGFVKDLSQLMDKAKISVNPIRFGAGVKGKVLTSMSYGVPCIGSRIAIEGIGAIPEQQILVADDPEEFASNVVRLYTDKSLWETLSAAGADLVCRKFSLEVVAKGFLRIFNKVLPDNYNSDLNLERISTYSDYKKSRSKYEQHRRKKVETTFAAKGEPIITQGHCFVCKRDVDFNTDFMFGSQDEDGILTPNWRERVVCPFCGLNNRMRAAIHMFHLLSAPVPENHIYLTEQTTPLFAWFKKNYPNSVGSEYLGDSIPFGDSSPKGIRNESLASLSFSDNLFDAILSFDVLEHIPEYEKALKECHRCLKPGGTFMFTVPFDHQSLEHIVRAEVDNSGQINHILPPEYHGDPINPDGCLCFYYFGWQIIDQLKSLGFRDAAVYIYWSIRYGYLGGEQILFRAIK